MEHEQAQKGAHERNVPRTSMNVVQTDKKAENLSVTVEEGEEE